jgi:hypothetical protein
LPSCRRETTAETLWQKSSPYLEEIGYLEYVLSTRMNVCGEVG